MSAIYNPSEDIRAKALWRTSGLHDVFKDQGLFRAKNEKISNLVLGYFGNEEMTAFNRQEVNKNQLGIPSEYFEECAYLIDQQTPPRIDRQLTMLAFRLLGLTSSPAKALCSTIDMADITAGYLGNAEVERLQEEAVSLKKKAANEALQMLSAHLNRCAPLLSPEATSLDICLETFCRILTKKTPDIEQLGEDLLNPDFMNELIHIIDRHVRIGDIPHFPAALALALKTLRDAPIGELCSNPRISSDVAEFLGYSELIGLLEQAAKNPAYQRVIEVEESCLADQEAGIDISPRCTGAYATALEALRRDDSPVKDLCATLDIPFPVAEYLGRTEIESLLRQASENPAYEQAIREAFERLAEANEKLRNVLKGEESEDSQLRARLSLLGGFDDAAIASFTSNPRGFETMWELVHEYRGQEESDRYVGLRTDLSGLTESMAIEASARKEALEKEEAMKKREAEKAGILQAFKEGKISLEEAMKRLN